MILKVRQFEIKSDNTFFFDNNIWMYLYAPNKSNQLKEKYYGDFLSYIIQRGRPIFVTALILSEFSNAYLRYSCDNWLADNVKDSRNKKEYFMSNDCAIAMQEISSAIKNILKITVKVPDDFHSINTDAILNNLSLANFNDAYYLEFCKGKNIHFVTDDSDFFNKLDHSNLQIVTL